MARFVRQSLKCSIERVVALAMRRTPVRNWPPWAADLFEIQVPAVVRKKPAPGPGGGSNINVILDLLDTVGNIPGAVAECGVYRGATLLPLALYVEQTQKSKPVYGFDSFLGFDDDIAFDLSITGASDSEKRRGGFSETSQRLVQRRIDALGLTKRTQLVPGYFKASLRDDVDQRYSFVHLDCDIYESYVICLEHFHHRLNQGGVILLDEYNDPPWPGCNLAVDEFQNKTKIELHRIERDGFEKFFFKKE